MASTESKEYYDFFTSNDKSTGTVASGGSYTTPEFTVNDRCFQTDPCQHQVEFKDGTIKSMNGIQILALYLKSNIDPPKEFNDYRSQIKKMESMGYDPTKHEDYLKYAKYCRLQEEWGFWAPLISILC